MKLRKPSPLPKKGTIGIVAPASPQRDNSRLERGVRYLEQLGYQVKLGDNVHQVHGGYLAGTDEERAADINAMFTDNNIDAIFCSRGGYGSARLLHLIDYAAVRKNPKVFVGFSDITALQNALLAKSGLVTFSGALPSVDMADTIDAETEEWFWRAITSTVPLGALPMKHKLTPVQPGTAEGRLIGGNLSVFNTLIGTPFMPVTRNAILALEDVGEETYRIDRLLGHLENAGVLNSLAGLVTGEWSQSSRPTGTTPTRDVNEVIAEYATAVDGPVSSGLVYGHVAKKHTLPIGVRVRLSSRGSGLRFLEAACER